MLAIALASQVFAVSVDFYDEQQNNSSATGIRLRINNDSNAPINDAKLRYYFHRTSLPDSVDAYYVPYATVSKSYVNDTLAYFELSIPSIPVGFYPDMSGFSLALHDQNWSSWDKSKDYSYQVSSSLMENAKVVLLSGDNVIFGEAPDAQFVPEPGILKISGLKFSDSSWLEIKNVGGSTVAMSEFQIVNANDSAFSLGNDSLAVNEILRICQNQAACGDAEKTLVNSVFGWDSTGEAILKKDTSMASYVAWGEPGLHAAAAVEVGLWNDSLDFFPEETHVQQHNADYIKNTFFRLKSKKSGYATDDWFAFTSNDNPAKANSVPLPIKTSANQPVYKLIPGENDVLFSWLPVKGINSYRVVVRDQNGNDVYNQETSGTSVSLALAPGNYDWTVIGDDEFNENNYYTDAYDKRAFYNFGIIKANINTGIYKQWKVHQIRARRDTKMLNLGYVNNLNKYSWDRPNLESKIVEPHETSRCWAIAIEVMNHFYGGNLTQDEIVYKGHFLTDEPLVSPFFDDGGTFADISSTLMWALNIENFDDLNYTKGAPSYEIVKNAIDHKKLVYVNVPSHSMVIFGYVGDANDYAFYLAFTGDNNGDVGTSLRGYSIESYYIPNVVDKVRMSDLRVHKDSDGDGITDFEEEERFRTNLLLVDTDNDGIEDKREIYNYTNTSPLSSIDVARPPYTRIIGGKENPVYTAWAGIITKADKNKNKIYAENDPDDNDDDIEDGLSNYNINNSSKIIIDNMDVPEDYTIFAREYVAINDNAKCYNTQSESDSYCKIASADEDIFSYDSPYTPISIGARAHVGDIDFCNRGLDQVHYPNTRDRMTLRNSAVVHGNINAYVLRGLGAKEYKKYDDNYNIANELYAKTLDISDFIDMFNGSSVQGEASLHVSSAWNKNFTYLYSTDMPSIPETQILHVRKGETYNLKDGDQFKILRVQAGGTLIIEPGEMFVDSVLQIDANATIRFAEPGKGTVLHTNGKILWHTYNSEPATNTQYWINVAKGFKLAHHSSQKFYLEGMWAGTIYAPKAKVIMGQVTKAIYGRILARDVVVHQFAKFYRVDFNPTDAMQVSYAF